MRSLDEIINADEQQQHEHVYLVRQSSGRSSRQSRPHPPPLHRVLSKSGRSTVSPSESLRPLLGPIYIKDLANTLINCNWNWTLLIISGGFFLIWLVFACIWMIISLNNGDFNSNNNKTNDDEICLNGIQGFAGYLMFSIETQTTIGFGNRSINHNCPEAVVVLCIQMMVGTCICGILVSIVYEKISGPHKISPVHAFSRNATVHLVDGVLVATFRVRDCDRRYQCHTEIRAFLVRQSRTSTLGVRLESLKLETPGILLWPLEVVHRITPTSPLWDLSARDLIIKRIEIIVVMEGTCLYTSNPSSTCTSYVSREILWGHRFKKCVKYDKEDEKYTVYHKLFNKTEEISTPLCSAKLLNEIFNANSLYYFRDDSNDSGFPEDSSVIGGTTSSPSDITSCSISPVIVHRPASSRDNENNAFGDLDNEEDDSDHRKSSLEPDNCDPLFISLEKFVSKQCSNSSRKYTETSF